MAEILYRPGPFAFLASLGAAGGLAFEQAEKARQQKVKEAQQNLNSMIALRAAGYLDPSAFSSAKAMETYRTLGITPLSDEPTAGERKEGIQRDYFQASEDPGTKVNIPIFGMEGTPLGAGQNVNVPATARFTDEQRLAAGLPSRSAVTTEKLTAGKAERQLNTLQSGSPAQQRAIAEVPGPNVAEAAEQIAAEPFYLSIGDRSAASALVALGGNIERMSASPQSIQQWRDAAWETAKNDARSRNQVINEEVTRPYIDAAINAQLRQLDQLKAQMALAGARGQTAQDRAVEQLNRQQQRVQAAIDDWQKREPDLLKGARATEYAKALAAAQNNPTELAKLQTDPEFFTHREAYQEVQLYNKVLQGMYDERARLGDIVVQTIEGTERVDFSPTGVQSRAAQGEVPPIVSPGAALPPDAYRFPGASATTPNVPLTKVVPDATLRRMASAIRNKQATLADLDKLVADGSLTQAAADTVKAYVKAP